MPTNFEHPAQNEPSEPPSSEDLGFVFDTDDIDADIGVVARDDTELGPRDHRADAERDKVIHTFSTYFSDRLEPKDITDPDEAAAYSEWPDSLSPEEKEALDWLRYREEDGERVKSKILETAPDLFEGKLPREQAEALGSTHYVIGVNQSGTESLSEAIAYINTCNGVGLRGGSLTSRFKLLDEGSTKEAPSATEDVIVNGYYADPSEGKFIIAVPMDKYHQRYPAYTTGAVDSAFYDIDDFTTESEHDGTKETSVSPKYIAGYIDNHGTYFKNTNFGKSADLALGDIIS